MKKRKSSGIGLEMLGREMTHREWAGNKAQLDAKVRSLIEINRSLSAENERLLHALRRFRRQVIVAGTSEKEPSR